MATVAFQTIVQGEDRTLPLQIIRSDGGSFDLSTATEITAEFTNQDGTVLSLTLTGGKIVVSDAPAGRFSVIINETESAALKLIVGTAQDFTVIVDAGADRRIINFTKGLKVIKPAVGP